MQNKLIFFVVFLIFTGNNANAQLLQDTLSWQAYFNIVKKYHPVSQQALLLNDLARAKRTKAFGGFDPKLEAEFDEKNYDGTEYYSFFTPQIKLPLWYGIELKGSYSEAEGAFLNPESKLPKEGLSYAGVGFQIGKGLFIDERRAAIKQATIFTQASENDRLRIINDLFFDAGAQYIEWQNNYQLIQIYRNSLTLAKDRFQAVKQAFQNGDKPAIDTLEALLIVQQRTNALQQGELELQNAKLMLSNYLWLENTQPIDGEKLNIIPADTLIIRSIVELQVANNPKLLSYNFKLSELGVDRRLKLENLKPELGFQLGVLNQGQSMLRNINSNYWENNNKVNVRFSFPLTLSKARGELAEVNIKIKQTQLEQELLRTDLLTKIKVNSLELSNLESQLKILEQTYQSSLALLKGEEMRFELGESSLFLINSRESKLIEVQEKLLLTQAKITKLKLKTFWLNGTLPSEI